MEIPFRGREDYKRADWQMVALKTMHSRTKGDGKKGAT